MIKAFYRIVIIMTLLTAAVSVSGQTAASIDKQAYERNLKRWNSLTEKQRQAIRDKASKVTPEKLAALRKKLNALNTLPPEKRDVVEKNYNKFKVMTHKERMLIRKRHQQFLHMSEVKKRELLNKSKMPVPKQPVVVPVPDPVHPPVKVVEPIERIEKQKALERAREREKIKALEREKHLRRPLPSKARDKKPLLPSQPSVLPPLRPVPPPMPRK